MYTRRYRHDNLYIKSCEKRYELSKSRTKKVGYLSHDQAQTNIQSTEINSIYEIL